VILRWHRAPWACLTFDVQCPPDFFVVAHAELMGWKLNTWMSSATAFIFRSGTNCTPGRCPDLVPIASIRLTRRLLASIRMFIGQPLPSSFDIRGFVLVNIRAMGGVRGHLLPLRLVSAPRLVWDQT